MAILAMISIAFENAGASMCRGNANRSAFS